MAFKCPVCQSDNPDTQRFCGACGTPLPPSAGAVRPQVTETLSAPTRELTTGSTFAGRYQVIEVLGHGGMGKVYRVLDRKLKEEVALKLIRPEIALNKETIERFSNELRLARKIGHRNVGRMYELLEDEGTHFITMEYVAGEDLKSFIRRSRQLTVGTAVAIGKQVAEGLAEAHRLGVVHRDLKPSNIMIDKDGNARIMDFGIARSLGGKGLTGAGAIIGTPEYMSPEQVEGKEADQRSDIYSLGVVLFEMVTGQVPFEGETAFSIANKHKTEPPPVPKKLAPQVPETLNKLILRCLEKDRARRYQTTEELVTDLTGVEEYLPTAERVVSKRKAVTPREITVKFQPRRLVVPAAIILGLAVTSLLIWRSVVPKPAPQPPSAATGLPTLAVLYFENKSGDEKLDNWRDGLAELLAVSLSQSKYIRVVSGEEMYTILKRLGLADAQKYSSEDIEKIAAQTRATHVLRGSYITAGESFVITAGLQKPGTSESPTALRLEARGENEIIPKVDELTRQVKEGLNLTAAQIAGDIEIDAGKITTSSPEALKYYVEGRRYQLRFAFDRALAFMKKAVEIDPEFAMAYRAMSSMYASLGPEIEQRKCIKKALELSARLPGNERLLIEGQLFYSDENYARARELFEKLVKTYPGNIIGYSWLSLSYSAVCDFDKAVEQQEIAVRNLRTALGVGNLAEIYSASGLYQKAEEVCRSFLQDIEDNYYVRFELMYSYLYRRRLDLAVAEGEKVLLANPRAKSHLGTALLCKDDLAGAEKIMGQDAGLMAGREDFLRRSAVLLTQGKFEENIGFCRRNLEDAKGKKESEPNAYLMLAGALEKAGRYEEAEKALDQYLKLSAEIRNAEAESDVAYLPSRQRSDLFLKGIIQTEMKSFAEAEKTAGELKALIDKAAIKREMRRHEYLLGLIELGKKDYRRAAELFEQACGRLVFEWWLEPDPTLAMLLGGLARASYESGDLDKARQEYEKITLLTTARVRHGDIYARAYSMLGKIAEKQRDKARAIENYRKFLDLWKDADPGLPEVPDAKARLAALGM